MFPIRKFIFSFLLFLFVVDLSAQQTQIDLKITGNDDGQPVPYAHICTENVSTGVKSYLTSDKDGNARVNISGETILSISFVGYSTLTDTLTGTEKALEYKLVQSFYGINEVVVTGQHKPVPVDKSIYKIDLIGQTEIKQKAASNLAELLSNELSISVSNDPSTGSSLKMQGISGQNVKILIDGVPVIGRLDGDIDISQLDLSNVDHIEIVEGPMSVIYGSNALGGVINLISKDNRYAKVKTSLNLYYETVGVYNTDLNLAFKNKKHSFIVSGGRDFFGGFDSDASSRSSEYKPKEQYNVAATYHFTGKKSEVKLKNDFFKENLLDRSNAIGTPYSIRGYDTWFYTTRNTTSAQFDKKLATNSSFNILGAYSYYDRTKQQYVKDLTTLDKQLSPKAADHDTTRFDGIMARGVYNWNTLTENISIQAGFDINYEHGSGKRMVNNEEMIADYAAFAGLIWNITPEFTFQPGMRVAYNTKYDAPLVPSLNLKYSPGDLSFRGSYARGFRAPSLKELYLHFFDSNHRIEGNEDLIAEDSHNFNFSTGYKLDAGKSNFNFTLKAFYNNINNMIKLVQVDPKDDLHYSNQNIGHFESLGGDFNIEYQYFPYLKIQTGVSRLGGTDVYDETKFVFNNNFVSNVTVNLLKNTAHFSVYYKLFGRSPYYTNFGKLQMNYMDSYQDLDITVSKSMRNKSLEISGGVKNVFNNTIISGTAGTGGTLGHASSSGNSSVAGWGRTWFVGLKYNFVKY